MIDPSMAPEVLEYRMEDERDAGARGELHRPHHRWLTDLLGRLGQPPRPRDTRLEELHRAD
jgi:hypothetical protein